MSRFAVIGGGDAGAGWAARFLLNGWDVAVHDVDIEPVLTRARRTLPMLYECALPPEGRVFPAATAAEALAKAEAAFAAEPSALETGDMPVFSEQAEGLPAYLWPFVPLNAAGDLGVSILASVGMARGDAQVHVPEAAPEDRDRVLVALLRALKRENSGAGRVIAAHEKTLDQSSPGTGPLITVRRTIPSDWTDYNGHMNESRYGQIWSDAADWVLLEAGVDADYIARDLSYFTAETRTNFLDEALAGERVVCETQVALAEGKKLRLLHEMKREADGTVLATCDQFLLHVSLETRRSCPPEPAISARLEAMRNRA